jgi:hypothetical protein
VQWRKPWLVLVVYLVSCEMLPARSCRMQVLLIANEPKGIRRNLTTNEAGVFNAPALVPAQGYTVTATSQGFKTWELKEIEIQVGQNINLNIGLEISTSTYRC